MPFDKFDIPNDQRPIPFWSWNDQLDVEELRIQVRAMHAAGFGGFFMHARAGLRTEYLSPAWLACIEACLEEAEKCGMDAWLYDENGYPSGFGGGLVNGLGSDFQQKILRFERGCVAGLGRENTIAYYTADGTFLGRTPPDTGAEVLRIFYEINAYYTDNLNPASAREFLRVTHDFYIQHLPAHLLKRVKGVFCDEPQLTRNAIPWSLVLEAAYQEAYARELVLELPQLFRGGAESAPTRIRFWKLVTKLFDRNFFQPIYQWCEEHHWQLAGHLLQEEDCQTQICCNGSGMAHYRYFQLPGMDHLLRRAPHPVAMTQVFSVAEQYGKKQILGESFALCGWNLNFSGMCWIFQQQLVHGVNVLCHHLLDYSLRGQRKRDCPGSWFRHQPWWGDFRRVNDYFARVGAMLSAGRAETRVAVLHPIATAWQLYEGCDDHPQIIRYSAAQERLTRELDSLQIAHHYADEQILEESGSIDGKCLRIGECVYEVLIIPPIAGLGAATLALLRQLQHAGGTIYVVRNIIEPQRFAIDGEAAAPEVAKWFRALPHCAHEQAAAAAVAELFPERVRIVENGVPAQWIQSCFREFSGNGRERFYFLVNVSDRELCQAQVSLPRSGSCVEVIDHDDGGLRRLRRVNVEKDRLVFDYTFSPGEALALWVSSRSGGPEDELAADALAQPVLKRLPDSFALVEPPENLLTLDFCHCRVDGADWGRIDLRTLQNQLLALHKECDVELNFAFTAADDFDLQTPLQVLVESPEKYQFRLNGNAFPARDQGYGFDPAFRRIALPGHLRRGENHLVMQTRFWQAPEVYAALERAKRFETECNKLSFDCELESIYLCGDFSVRHTGGIEQLDRGAVRFNGDFALAGSLCGRTLSGADLTMAGFPFFAGKLQLRQTFHLTETELEELSFLRFSLRGFNSCEVKINGQKAGFLYAPPLALPIQKFCRTGDNILELQFTASLRNLLGPHHLAEGESYAVGMFSFNRHTNVIGVVAEPFHEGYCCIGNGITALELCKR